MHIGINAQLLSYGQNYRNGGVSRYIRHLLTELAKRPGNHTYTIFVNGQDIINQLEKHPQITYESAPWSEARPATRVAWEQLTLPTLIQHKHIDILHSPVNVLPERIPGSCATVVTLHDLAFLRFPNVLTTAKRLYHRTFTVRSLKRASTIIAVSESTRQDVHELVGVPLERIQTVHMCIDEHFSNVLEGNAQEFREQHGLAQGFILFLGTLEPRKNIVALIEAYALLRQKYGRQEKLVLAGGKGWLYDTIFQQVKQLGLEQEVIFPGFVDDTEQVRWYQAAAAFAYPSLYEGFGIPVAEALACGTPVVTSTTSSLPEAGANVALCVDPHDTQALADALAKALSDESYRTYCQQQAPAIAEQFSTSSMVAKTLAVYEQTTKMHTNQRIPSN